MTRASPILISACLLGENVRYDGKNELQTNLKLNKLYKQKLLVPLCPEVSGGLPVPRPPAEIKKDKKNVEMIIDINGCNVTNEFELGAKKALLECSVNKIKVAILKESSPSCGSNLVYDGNFSSTKIEGEGVTTRLLRKNGITVFNEHQINQALEFHQCLLN